MFDHAELDLSRVYVHDGYLLKDVTTVGRHKAIGTLAFSPSPSDRFRTPDIDLRQIGETLESRGMRVFLDGPPAGRGHQQEIADLVRQLPQVRYDRKLKPGYFFLGKNTDLQRPFRWQKTAPLASSYHGIGQVREKAGFPTEPGLWCGVRWV